MKKQSDFVTHVLELLSPMKRVLAKRMFGGYGIYQNGLMFAIVDDDVLYLKVDDETRKDFEDRKLRKFTYKKQGKEMSLSFYEAPPEGLDASHILVEWAEKAANVAVRAQLPK